MPPLATAADILLCILKQGTRDIGHSGGPFSSSLIFYTNREIRQSLETVCAAMKALRVAGEDDGEEGGRGQYDGMIYECDEFLDSTQLQVGKRFGSEVGGGAWAGRPSRRQRTTSFGGEAGNGGGGE